MLKFVRQRGNLLVNVIFRREVLRIAPNVDSIGRLIHADIVDPHVGGERQMRKINGREARGHAEVHDNVLEENDS